MKATSESSARTAWLALAGLVALGITVLMVSEFPSMRRELRIMRM
ncbi:MAG TPA: hypothetical protein VNT26_18215 [Candidatus Sulfotelmatobacter sp.]|nr:hypothetical protein [Candidatus Sulfotelmatobacter sp.]